MERQRAKENYQRLHVAGQTEEAQADLARLALVRKQREEATKKREEEKKGFVSWQFLGYTQQMINTSTMLRVKIVYYDLFIFPIRAYKKKKNERQKSVPCLVLARKF